MPKIYKVLPSGKNNFHRILNNFELYATWVIPIFLQQDRHWSELIPSRDNVKTEKDNVVLPEMERKRREAVWELFKSEAVFLVDYLMVLKHVSKSSIIISLDLLTM